MKMIRNLKYLNGKNSIEEVIEHNDKRFEDIVKEFKKRKNSLISHSTEYTDHFERILIKANIYYIKEKCFFSELADLFYSDFYIPSLCLTIEIDGGYHNTKNRKYLDKIKEEFISNRGIATIRLSNEDCLKMKKVNKQVLLNEAFAFWRDKNNENRKEWKRKVVDSKDFIIHKLYNQFINDLEVICLESKVVMYDKNGVEWIFDNIFDLHFSTDMKFKRVVERLNRYNKRYKYNIKYC